MKKTYKKGTYVVFLTKQPEVHLNKMFGYYNLGPDDFEKTEHIGYIRTVIDDDTYVINTRGFYCTESSNDILRLASENEIPKDESERSSFIYDQGPNVYICQKGSSGDTLSEKCENAAREAMRTLFPEDEIVDILFGTSEYKKSDLQDKMKLYLSSIRKRELIKKKHDAYKYYMELLQKMRFKEYYSVRVFVKNKTEKATANCYLITIDMKMEEVMIMRNNEEMMCFLRCLGPEFDSVDRVRKGIIHKFQEW